MSASFAFAFIVPLFLSENVVREIQAVRWRAEGRQEAERDIADGQMKYKNYGYMAGHRERDKAFARLMQERYAVEVVAVAQCCVTDELVENATGYDDRIQEELDSKFGPGALKRTWADSAKWQERPLGRWGLRSILFLSASLLLWRMSRRIRGNQTPAPM